MALRVVKRKKKAGQQTKEHDHDRCCGHCPLSPANPGNSPTPTWLQDLDAALDRGDDSNRKNEVRVLYATGFLLHWLSQQGSGLVAGAIATSLSDVLRLVASNQGEAQALQEQRQAAKVAGEGA
jgi:hypothetical protein